MKNVIIKYGLIAGAIAAASELIITLIFKSYGFDKIGFDYSAYFGYSLIILSMTVIFFGIKAYRDNENAGKITFLKGLMLGLGIALISCVCYTLMWMFVYYNYMPNFMQDYAHYYIEKLKSSGASEAEILKSQTEMTHFQELYKSPVTVFALTFIEPLPIGIAISLVSSLILKRK